MCSLNNPCSNGGICERSLDGYVCKCASNYTGQHCERLNDQLALASAASASSDDGGAGVLIAVVVSVIIAVAAFTGLIWYARQKMKAQAARLAAGGPNAAVTGATGASSGLSGFSAASSSYYFTPIINMTKSSLGSLAAGLNKTPLASLASGISKAPQGSRATGVNKPSKESLSTSVNSVPSTTSSAIAK